MGSPGKHRSPRYRSLLVVVCCASWCGTLGWGQLPIVEDTVAADARQRILEIDQELNTIPAPRVHLQSRRGFHSDYLPSETEPYWIELDLFGLREFQRIALIPAHGIVGNNAEPGYGFPKRYRIEVSDDRSPNSWRTIVDRTASDEPNPGVSPVLIDVGDIRCQYVRLVSTKHWHAGNGLWAVALSEFMLLQGNENEASCASVRTASRPIRIDGWGDYGLVDTASILGLPTDGTESPTDGFRSEYVEQADADVWVQVDLGRTTNITEVQLFPVSRPDDLSASYGFPVEVYVELSNDPTFQDETTVRSEFGYREFVVAASGVVAFRVEGWCDHPVRYVRVRSGMLRADERRRNGASYVMALGEIQVFERERNVALGCPSTSNAAAVPDAEGRWSLESLTDGYVHQGKILPIGDYLDLQAKRGELDRERRELRAVVAGREHKREARTVAVLWWLTALTVAFGAFVYWRGLRETRRRVDNIRTQIARDLHDEIGSLLATIQISSDLAIEEVRNLEDAQTELGNIRDAAADAGHAMRNIVWLVNTETASSTDLVEHLRRLARLMLRGTKVTINEGTVDRYTSILLERRRNAVLAFTETLNNVRKHARASRVDIDMDVQDGFFRFRVVDDGVGVSDAVQLQLSESGWAGSNGNETLGHGLQNVVNRAHEMDGDCFVRRVENGGTEVRWSGKVV